MRKTSITLLASLSVLASCTVAPEPIHYGNDNCTHCDMTIMDNRYGTEIVTKKGKIFKFDSVECLVGFLRKEEQGPETMKYFLFTSFNTPGILVDATTSYVLHSKELPSPMGRFLTAFEDEATALEFRNRFGGKILSWDKLLEEFDYLR